MTDLDAGWIQLRSAARTAAINPFGAELSVLRAADGRDLLWNGDPAWWAGRAPILFPIVGELRDGRYEWQGARYDLSRHGFARRRRFELVRSNEEQAVFRLVEDADTLKVYPFRFELEVTFRLDGTALGIEAAVRNTGSGFLPASLGFHPAFRWPLAPGGARDALSIEFETEEPGPIRRLDARGLLTAQRHPTPVRGTILMLEDALFREDVVIFDQLRSRSLTYGAPGAARLRISFPDATYLGLWSKPGAGFICIEPWRGVADPVDASGALDAKPGMMLIGPGERQALCMQIE